MRTRKALDAPEKTAREPRLHWPSVDRRTALGVGILSAVGLAALGATNLPRAFAADYPSWDDVLRAQQNANAKAGEISKIEGLIQSLQAEVQRTQQLAAEASDAYYTAQQNYLEAAYRAEDLQGQADAEAQKAVDAASKAGRVASKLYRNGGDDTALELLFAGSAAGADDLLARLGTMDKLLQRNQSVYADATTARDSAQSLSQLAEEQRVERDRLQQIAEQKMIEAQAAADAAQVALDAQELHLTELQAQLVALKDASAKTLAEHQAGVEAERRRKEEERRRKEEEARRAAEEAAKQGGGVVQPGGWARPGTGWLSSGYGARTPICSGGYCSRPFHYGIDLAAGAWSPIYAAAAGTVVYAAWNGTYGNYIKIDHGGGIATGYAHIVNGGTYVRVGQWVNAGQNIAGVGTTGASNGNHLHFEVYTGSGTTEPIAWLRARGVTI